MKLKKITACLIIAVMLVLTITGCSDESQNNAIHNQLIGGWILADNSGFAFNADGSILSFDVCEFSQDKLKYHRVHPSSNTVDSYYLADYTIKNGKVKIVSDGQDTLTGVAFTDDGNMLWYENTGTSTFRRVTDEEIEKYDIPIGKTIPAETAINDSETTTEATT